MIKRLAILGVIALVVGISVRLLVAPVVAGSASLSLVRVSSWSASTNCSFTWEPLWFLTAPALTDMSLAPDGSTIAWIDTNGVVRRLAGDNGLVLWQTPPYPGMNQVRVSRHGDVLLYSSERTGRNVLRLLDAEVGASRSSLALIEGRVTSVEITPNGERAVIGVDSSRAYSVPMHSGAAYYGQPLALPDTPVSMVAFVNNDNRPLVYCGTKRGGLFASDILVDKPFFKEKRPINRQPVVHLVSSPSGEAIAVAYAAQGTRPARLELWDRTRGFLLWSVVLEGKPEKLRISADGNLIAVNYRAETTSASGVAGRKVTLFDRTGKRLFAARGGLSFSPEVLTISPRGDCLTVRDADGSLWLLDQRGHNIARLRPPTDRSGAFLTLNRAIASEDGSYLLLHYQNTYGESYLMYYRFRQATS